MRQRRYQQVITPGRRRLSVCTVAMFAIALLQYPATAMAGPKGGRSGPGCSAAARDARRACMSGALSDRWLAIGICDNLPTRGERRACVREAVAEWRDTIEECGEQHAERKGICDDLGEAPYVPIIDPLDFVADIDNPYFPLVPGTTFIYETPDGVERVEVEVTFETVEVLGVTCIVVRDTAYEDGEAVEITDDWYAQDVTGNVWYFGEVSQELEDGELVSLDGSWKAGRDGAQPGIIMPADPQPGDLYRQEYALGEAEDMAEVVSLTGSASVPYGNFVDTLVTLEFSPLEPEVAENKLYAVGVGLVLEVDLITADVLELIDIVP